MALYSVETKKGPEEIVAKAKAFFGEGEDGLGLSVSAENPCCVTFIGGGGHVSVTASEGEDRTEVTLETREWDHQVKTFMRRV